MRRWRIPWLLLGLSACEHSQPAAPGNTGSGPLPALGTPNQLTYNPGDDRTPSWLPDGSGILYSAEQLDGPDRDRCLYEIPPTGGQAIRVYCHRTPSSGDTTDVFQSPVVAADGRLAYVFATSIARFHQALPSHQYLVVATWQQPENALARKSFPYSSSTGMVHLAASHLTWLGDGSLIYLGQRLEVIDRGVLTYPPADTIRTGLELMQVTNIGPNAVYDVLPGTAGASSVVAVGDTIYFTRNGDSRVYRRVLPGGADSVVYDFGGLIARDVSVEGSQLVAVVGGMVYYSVDAGGLEHQLDNGGDLHLVDLTTGSDKVMPVLTGDTLRPIWYRHPALSPDGRILVADGKRYFLVRHVDAAGNLLYTDTLIDSNRNLYEYELP
jgi:WD40-like Beta Propeller Repeat